MTSAGARGVRVALVGGGDHGLRSVVQAVSTLGEWSLAAVVDPEPAARQRAAALVPQAIASHRLEALAEHGAASELNLLVIATPPAVSAALLQQALSLPAFARTSILLEKPGAVAAAELHHCANAAAAHTPGVTVAYSYRHHATVTAFRQSLRRLGTIHELTLTFVAPFAVRGWRASPATGGGALRDLGAHLIDLARILVPGAWSVEEARFRSHATEHDDVLLRARAGDTSIILHAAYVGNAAFSLSATGSAGRVSCDLWQHTTPYHSWPGRLASRWTTPIVPSLRPATRLRRSYAATLKRSLGVASAHGALAIPPASLHDAAAVLACIAVAESGGRA